MQVLKLAAAQAGLMSWVTSQVGSLKVDAPHVTRGLAWDKQKVLGY